MKKKDIAVIAAPKITGGGTLRGPAVVVTQTKSAPISIEDYPPLVEWLTKIDARCLWQHGDKFRSLGGWTANGCLFVVLLYADKRGFDILTAPNTNDIGETFTDAEQRMAMGDGLPYNPPAQPYTTRRALTEAGASFVSVGNGEIVSRAVIANQDDQQPTIFWFWTYKHRAWCVGPYSRRIDAIDALERFEALPSGPHLRVWGV